MKKKEKKYTTIYTPIGIGAWLYLVKPDIGRKESSGKFSVELYVPKADFLKDGKDMVTAVTNVAREGLGNKKLNLNDIQNPFKDMDTVKDCPEWAKGTYRIRAKAGRKDMAEADWNNFRPTVIAPRKVDEKFPIYSLEQIKEIKAGDFMRLICSVYTYEQKGGGVALGLNFVQFVKEGKALGQGKMKAIENLDEVEVTVDSPEEMFDTEESDDTDPMLAFG